MNLLDVETVVDMLEENNYSDDYTFGLNYSCHDMSIELITGFNFYNRITLWSYEDCEEDIDTVDELFEYVLKSLEGEAVSLMAFNHMLRKRVNKNKGE